MLYLIGGPPRTGKTILAAALAQKASCPYFSIDHIAQVIVPYSPEQDYAVRLPLHVARQEAHYSNDSFYGKYSPEESVDLYLRQAETYWPGVENFINYALEDDHDLIIEGWHILPKRLRRVIAPHVETHPDHGLLPQPLRQICMRPSLVRGIPPAGEA